MTLLLVGMTLLYVFLLAILLLVLVSGKLPLTVKFLLSGLVALAYVFAWDSWKETQGWPGKLDLPEQFILHASVIEEPDQETGTSGRIFMWGSTLSDAYPASEPRAYEVAYDKEIHSRLEEARRQQRNGKVQIGSVKQPEGKNTRNKSLKLGEKKSVIEFSTLPDPALPEK